MIYSLSLLANNLGVSYNYIEQKKRKIYNETNEISNEKTEISFYLHEILKS
jgi:hypothetical protein